MVKGGLIRETAPKNGQGGKKKEKKRPAGNLVVVTKSLAAYVRGFAADVATRGKKGQSYEGISEETKEENKSSWEEAGAAERAGYELTIECQKPIKLNRVK